MIRPSTVSLAVRMIRPCSSATASIGGYQAPLYYVNPTQLDVQIPSELVPNRQYQMIASANGALTLPQTIDVVPFQPGTAFNADGSVIAQHPDATLVKSASPAEAGEAVRGSLGQYGSHQSSGCLRGSHRALGPSVTGRRSLR